MSALRDLADELLSAGKGLLAADESAPTIAARFSGIGIESTAESRRSYRDLLFSTPGLNEAISGVILFDETMRQTIGGVCAPAFLSRNRMIPGIKVDAGTTDLAGFPGERVTEGLDGLRGRLAAYRGLGARFTKWRSVFAIGDGLPTATCVEANAQSLAVFAALSQEAGLLPIVEPEILMAGAHSLERCETAATRTLDGVFRALRAHRVVLEEMLLKTGMVLPGLENRAAPDASAIAEATRRCLLRTVPAAVPGVVFLSGGQGEQEATARLDALCRSGRFPWTLSFSFGRALQESALKAWRGNPANTGAAQAALLDRARANAGAVRVR